MASWASAQAWLREGQNLVWGCRATCGLNAVWVPVTLIRYLRLLPDKRQPVAVYRESSNQGVCFCSLVLRISLLCPSAHTVGEQ